MKKLIYNFSRGKILIAGLLLAGVFVFAGSNDLAAQQSAGGGVNPETEFAQRVGVTIYPLGTFDRTHAMEVVEQIRKNLRPQMQHNPPLSVRLKFAYADKMFVDLQDHIAAEITLLRSLRNTFTEISTTLVGQVEENDLAILYNEMVSKLQ